MSRNVKGNVGEADAALRTFMAEIDKGCTKLDNPTIERVLVAWMADRRNATPLTRAADQGYIDRRIVPALGKIHLDRLKASDLDRAYAGWLDEGPAPATVRKMHAIISSALHQAVKWEWIDRAVSELASPPSTKPTITRFITPDELVKLIQAAREVNPTLAMAISLGAVTGARRGELCALRWSNVDFDTATLTIRQSLSVLKGAQIELGETKTHQVRRLILDAGTLRLLEWWREQQEDLARRASVALDRDPYNLTNDPRGRSPILPNTISHQFPRLAKSLDPPLPYHFRELRPFAATQFFRRDRPEDGRHPVGPCSAPHHPPNLRSRRSRRRPQGCGDPRCESPRAAGGNRGRRAVIAWLPAVGWVPVRAGVGPGDEDWPLTR